MGAQLIACVLGATVCANKHKEIGWFPIDINSSFSGWLQVDVPSKLTVFHWHGDKFEIPYGAINHAVSNACDHQLFTHEQNIIGLQFHLEATINSVQQIVENASHELVNGEYIQDQSDILSTSRYYEGSNTLMSIIQNKLINTK